MRLASLLLSFALLAPLFLFAAEETSSEPPYEPFIPEPGTAPVPNPSELSSCFDYYRFGSTPILVSSDLGTVAQGSPIAFSGTITNENTYPLTDAAIYGKIFYRKDPSAKDSFGPEVYDVFLIEGGITLKAGETKKFEALWQVPQDADIGEYQLATFVVDHDRFNLLGLIFSNDIIGAGTKFTVVGTPIGNTKFDIYQTTVGSEVLHAAAFAPRVSVTEEGSLPITVHLVNTTPTQAKGTVRWSLYTWDSLQERNLISQTDEPVVVEAGQDLPLTFSTNHGDYAVYNLIVEYAPADNTKVHSFQSIRYINPGVQTPRINFVGATGFPGNEGDTVFVCIHSSGTKRVENARLEVSASSNNFLDWIIGRGDLGKKEYSGSVPGAISALMFPLLHDSSAFTVNAKLYQNDALVDEVSVAYTCKVSPEGCKPPYLLIGIGILVLLLGGWLFMRRRNKESMNVSPSSV